MARQMNYQQASAGSGRGISAGQWNGFLAMHRDYYNGGASNGPLPPILSKSIIANAVLSEGSEDVLPFQPVRIVKQINFTNIVTDMPSYVVEAVDAVDSERHGNYGFTLGEGMTEKGGRIVVSGIAIVAMDASELRKNKPDDTREGSFDSSFYVVPDETLSPDDDLIAPTGHFKLLSWYVPGDFSSLADTDTVYVAIDMNKRPTSFIASIDTTINATSEAAGITTMSGGVAYTFYTSTSDTATITLDLEKDDAAYEISVYNPLGEAVPSGDRLVSYSLEYNRFLALASPSDQTVKIGKADADITVGSTGTISIWRNGIDTGENIENVDLDWMAGATDVSAGKEVMITWFADEGLWRITGAECEDA